ncbi:hypothetical protein FQR65_LT18796 [Abscondita terminalis]|nr:hypothetical protein FQR65_LT18796 [Abscondita terminalis]
MLKVLEYSLSEGNIEYREQLAKYYNKIGFADITPKNFIVTNGGSEALNFAISVLCDQDDEIIVPEPYYANYNGFSNALGVVVKSIPSSIDTGFALPPIEEFEKKITDKTKAFFICNLASTVGQPGGGVPHWTGHCLAAYHVTSRIQFCMRSASAGAGPVRPAGRDLSTRASHDALRAPKPRLPGPAGPACLPMMEPQRGVAGRRTLLPGGATEPVDQLARQVGIGRTPRDQHERASTST